MTSRRDYCEACGYTESHDPNCPRTHWNLPNDEGTLTFINAADAKKAEALYSKLQEEANNFKERWETCLQQFADEKDRSNAQFKKDLEARLTLTERAIAAESQLEQVRSELALAMRLMGNWREFPPSRVLAVGAPCAGAWIQSRVTEPYWSCRCGAKIPEQCKLRYGDVVSGETNYDQR